MVSELSAGDIAALVPMGDAVAAMRSLFAASPISVPRTVARFGAGDLLAMPAVGAAAGVKLLTVVEANAAHGLPVIQGIYVLFSAVDGRVRALLDGGALTSLRTPAVSAVATDVLADRSPRSLAVIGSGVQALWHLDAMVAVRPSLSEVVVDCRSEPGFDVMARRAGILGLTARRAEPGDVARCPIICCCTSSSEAVLHGPLPAGTHVNAVGSYLPERRELDAEVVADAAVYVDDRHAAHEEAGDLLRAETEGRWSWEALCGDLADLVAGRARPPRPGQVTVFKSVGLAIEDLAIAELAADRAGIAP